MPLRKPLKLFRFLGALGETFTERFEAEHRPREYLTAFRHRALEAMPRTLRRPRPIRNWVLPAAFALILIGGWWYYRIQMNQIDAVSIPPDAQAELEIARMRLESIRTTLTVAAGLGGAAALVLGFRRQQHDEYQTAQQHITELHIQAVEQLASDKATIRIGGLHNLDRLGDQHPELRQVILDEVCAYLRQPVRPDADGEHDVRRFAQEILQRRLRRRLGRRGYWSHIRLDLKHATLAAVNFRRCHFYHADFTGAVFVGVSDFEHASFNVCEFAGAHFEGSTDFGSTVFDSYTDFAKAAFADEVQFSGAVFHDEVHFSEAAFRRGAWFRNIRFEGIASFAESHFEDLVAFTGSRFDQRADFKATSFSGQADFFFTRFPSDAVFAKADFQDTAAFSWAAFHRDANFSEVRFRKQAYFPGSVFNGNTSFHKAEFHSEADFESAGFWRYLGELRSPSGMRLDDVEDAEGYRRLVPKDPPRASAPGRPPIPRPRDDGKPADRPVGNADS